MKEIINKLLNIATYIFLLVAIYLVFADCKEFAEVNFDLYSIKNKAYIYLFFSLRQLYNLCFLLFAYFLQTLKKEVAND